MVLWPLLYLKEEWCETKVKGQVSFLGLFFSYVAAPIFLSILYLFFSSYINFEKPTLIFLKFTVHDKNKSLFDKSSSKICVRVKHLIEVINTCCFTYISKIVSDH